VSGERVPVVKQCALDIDGDTVVIELICTSELAASVLLDDLKGRLQTGAPVAITITAGRLLEGNGA
jgi:hypothetical protein